MIDVVDQSACGQEIRELIYENALLGLSNLTNGYDAMYAAQTQALHTPHAVHIYLKLMIMLRPSIIKNILQVHDQSIVQ